MRTTLTRRLTVLALTFMASVMSISTFASEDEAAGPSLYERLGSMEGIAQIVDDTIALHHKNPEISHFFEGIDDEQLGHHVTAFFAAGTGGIDDEQLGHHVTAFFAAGTGGPANYEGRDMTTTHASMDMTDAEFSSAVADVLSAAEANGVDAVSRADVGAILESLRPAVMGTATE